MPKDFLVNLLKQQLSDEQNKNAPGSLPLPGRPSLAAQPPPPNFALPQHQQHLQHPQHPQQPPPFMPRPHMHQALPPGFGQPMPPQPGGYMPPSAQPPQPPRPGGYMPAPAHPPPWQQHPMDGSFSASSRGIFSKVSEAARPSLRRRDHV